VACRVGKREKHRQEHSTEAMAKKVEILGSAPMMTPTAISLGRWCSSATASRALLVVPER
jgi:hypothetical protein